MNAETDKVAGSEQSTETKAEQPTEADENHLIGDAVALGFLVGRGMVAVVGLLLIASGLWFAGLLIIFVTNLDLPRIAAQRHLRKHSAKLEIPSVKEVEATTLPGLLTGAGLIYAVCALAIAQALLGHPILSWSWKAFTDGVDLVILVPLLGVALFITISWIFRWRKRNKSNSDEVTR